MEHKKTKQNETRQSLLTEFHTVNIKEEKELFNADHLSKN